MSNKWFGLLNFHAWNISKTYQNMTVIKTMFSYRLGTLKKSGSLICVPRTGVLLPWQLPTFLVGHHGFWSCLRQIQMTNSSINAVMNLTKLGEKHKQMRRTSGRFPQKDHTKNGLISFFFWPDSLFWTTDQSWTQTSKHISCQQLCNGSSAKCQLEPLMAFCVSGSQCYWELALGRSWFNCPSLNPRLENFAVRRVLLWWLTSVFGTPLPKGQS